MSIMVAMGKGATSGCCSGDAAAIEAMRTIDAHVIDKTGTLTEGKPAFDRVVPTPGFSADDVLRIAASLDQASEHPLARAIVTEATRRKLALEKPLAFDSASGIGVTGDVGGRRVMLGNSALMQQAQVDVTPLRDEAEKLRQEGADVMYLAVDGRSARLLSVSDRSRRAHRCSQYALRAQESASSWLAETAGRPARRRRAWSTKSSAKSNQPTKSPLSRNCRCGARSSDGRRRYQLMRQRSRAPTSASRWAREPTSR
jgi:cation transport ATPase